MKRLFSLAFFFLIVSAASAQTFSYGTITYTINLQVPPELSKLLGSLAKGSEMTLEINGTSGLLKNPGLMPDNALLTLNGQQYRLDYKNKIAYKMDPTNPKAISDYKIVKSSGSMVILGHNCQKYVLTNSKGESGETIWASPDFKISQELKSMISKTGANASLYKDLVGMPLKITTGSGKMGVDMVVTNISKIKPPASDLIIPAGFTIKPYDAQKTKEELEKSIPGSN